MIIANLFTSHNIGFVIPFALLTASEFCLRQNSTKSLIMPNLRGELQSGEKL